MNIKKSIIFSIALLAAGSGFAQTSNLKKAKTNIAEYEKFRMAGNTQLGASFIEKAKEAIDLASGHEKTKDLSETWLYYALVYANLANDSKSDADATKAAEGVAKAKELDTKGEHKENIEIAAQQLYAFNFNQGIAAWQKEDFAGAGNYFEKGLIYNPGDTILTYYSGIAAIQTKDLAKGIEKYTQLIDRKDFSEHKTVVQALPSLYLETKDTVSALKYSGIAADLYPNDNAIVEQNINFNIALGNEAGIIEKINSQIQKDPTNKTLYFYLGIAESALKNNDKALAAYKKAVEIDPNYTDANLNAGVMLINSVREELMALNDDKSLTNNQYNAKVKELKEKIKPSEIYFLKALEAEPTNTSVLEGLKSLYSFLQEEEKVKEIQAKLDAL